MQKMHILTQVPEHIFSTPNQITVTQRWQKRFNVASWIRFDVQDNSPVRLLLRYRDTNGVRDVAVDQGQINSKTLLLSGVANLKLTGRLERIDVILQSDLDHYVVDELFVQPVPDKTSERSRPARKVIWGSLDN
ncbi:hypothetical protein [Saccharospirillum sp.]|uniref:hypothetical protein n=1 Tax=Saccharospirillum sp. TaxID=2033801 RepID=UPI0034A02FC2